MSEWATVILVAVAGMTVIAGIAIWGIKLSQRSTQDLRRKVFEVNRALAVVAERTGLHLAGGGSWEHPMVGAIPGWASLHGSRSGRTVHVTISQADEDEARMGIQVTASHGTTLDTAAKREATAITMPDGMTGSVRVERDHIIVMPYAARSGNASYAWAFPSDADAIEHAIDFAVAALLALELQQRTGDAHKTSL